MNSVRPYKQILNFLMEIMEQADFAPDYKLPSERMLAAKFKASRRSIRLAYDSLIAQGFVAKIHGKGHFTTGNRKNSDEAHFIIKKIYFILPEVSTTFSQNILNGIMDFCDKHTMDVSIKLSKGKLSKETRYINSALSSDAKGIILFPIDNEFINNDLLKLSANRYPVTIIDRYFKNFNSSFVSTNHYSAMMEAVRFLAAKKHKRFVYLTSDVVLATSVEERLKGYLAGVDKYYGENGVGDVLTLNTFHKEEVKRRLTAYLKANPDVEVIITTGVRTTTDAVIEAVQSLKLSIPKQIKLMVFDNDFSATECHLFQPYVILQDAYQIGYKSAAALYNQIYGDLRTENILLPATIEDLSSSQKRK